MTDMEHGDMSDDKKRMMMRWREQTAIRVLTAIIVVIFVFWCGFEFGEIRASIGPSYGGYRMMQTWGDGYGNTYYGRSGMMLQTSPTGTSGSVIGPQGAATN